MKKLKSLILVLVAALTLVASVFCANDASAYYHSPVSHGHYSRSACHGGCGGHRSYRHHGHHSYRHHGGHHGYRHHGHRGYRHHGHRSYRCHRCR